MAAGQGARAGHPKERREREKGRERSERKKERKRGLLPPLSTHKGPGDPWPVTAAAAPIPGVAPAIQKKRGGNRGFKFLGLKVEKSSGGGGDGDFGGDFGWWWRN